MIHILTSDSLKKVLILFMQHVSVTNLRHIDTKLHLLEENEEQFDQSLYWKARRKL